MMKFNRGQSNQPIDGLEDCVERCVGTRWNYWDSPIVNRSCNCNVNLDLPENILGYIPTPREYWFNFDLTNPEDGTDMIEFNAQIWESILAGRAISAYEILEAVAKYKASHPSFNGEVKL